MNKQVKYTFNGANQDISRSKHSPQFYYEGNHIRLLSTDNQSTRSVSNEKGNERVIELPSITINQADSKIEYGTSELSYTNGNEIDQQIAAGLLQTTSSNIIIIGHATSRDGIILFTTDDNGMDCIWFIDNVLNGEYSLELLYLRNIDFSINDPIQAIFNYENESIQKVYWVDGKNQIRNININYNNVEENEENLIDVPLTTLDFVGEVSFTQPYVDDIVTGGSHTSGMIQYAYNLYRLNSSQTKISPLSELIALDKGDNLGGGEVDEVIAQTPIVKIDGLDTTYTHLKVYAIKYTSYNEIPSINLIEEREIDNENAVIYDDGSVISSLSLEEFLFLGSFPLIPEHIETKDSRMLLANITTKDFVLPDTWDSRAYSHDNSGEAIVYDNVIPNSNGIPIGDSLTVNNTFDNVYERHSCINLDYDVFKYQSDGVTPGGEGKYIKYEFVQKTEDELDLPSNEYRFLKDREIYRIGTQFYNKLGQISLPDWITDFKVPSGNLEGNFNTLKITFKPEFFVWLNDASNFIDDLQKPIGFKLVRADRTVNDRTIICQGITNPMVVNYPTSQLYELSSDPRQSLREPAESTDKRTAPFMRLFEHVLPVKSCLHLRLCHDLYSVQGNTRNPMTEVQTSNDLRAADINKSVTFQYNVMGQLYSPELLFFNPPVNTGTQLSVIGGAKQTAIELWAKELNEDTRGIDTECKVTGGLSPWSTNYVGGVSVQQIQGNAYDMLTKGLIHDASEDNDDLLRSVTQFYRQFNEFVPSTSIVPLDIYGTPELTELGQNSTAYNGNGKYVYKNSLLGFLTDGARYNGDEGVFSRAIVNVNTLGTRSLIFVTANDDTNNPETDHWLRPTFEDIKDSTGIPDNDIALVMELRVAKYTEYLGNLYGGNSYEEKRRSKYIEIGAYVELATSGPQEIQIDNPGDTYVDIFKFTRNSRDESGSVFFTGNCQTTEVVEFKVETTVDLKNRHDLSISEWDTTFQPLDIEFNDYNDVYSQQPTLVQNENTDFTFRRINSFDTRIQSTKLKIPNENVDSWTDILANEVMDLDGKYGPINGLISFKDEIFTFQDEAIANISVNPRIQVQGSDGVGIELGVGGILYDYKYLTTKSGSRNKWGIVPTKKYIYYYDILNKGIGRVPDSVDLLLSDKKGLHTFFNENFDYDELATDNPLLGQGAVLGYDNYNNDIYITALQKGNNFTWCFNETINEFIDLKPGYTPSRYISKGERFIIPNSDNNDLYEQGLGEYNKWFDTYYPSYITLMVNPDADYSCVFDNVFYKSELYLNDIDQPEQTLTHIQAWNEYQDSGRIPLVVGRNSNLRRKFRKWQANIPREGRNRMRNPWIFLKLELDNTDNYRMILHDIIVDYTI